MLTGKVGGPGSLLRRGRDAGRGSLRRFLLSLLFLKFGLDFRVRHRNKPPHKIRELREVTCFILAGTIRDTRFGFSLHLAA